MIVMPWFSEEQAAATKARKTLNMGTTPLGLEALLGDA